MNCLCAQFRDLNAKDILMWRHPLASSIVLVSSLGIWSLFAIFDYTLVTFLAHLLLLVFMIGAGVTLVKGTLISSNEIPGRIDAIYETLRPHFVNVAHVALHYLTWKDFKSSASLFAVTLIIGFIGKFFSDKVIIFFAIIGAFSFFVVRDKYGYALEQPLAYFQEMLSELPRYAEKASSHLPPGIKDKCTSGYNYVKAQYCKYMHNNSTAIPVSYTTTYTTSNDAAVYAEEQLNAMEQKME